MIGYGLRIGLLSVLALQTGFVHAAYNSCWEPDIWSRFCPFGGFDLYYAQTQGRANWNNTIPKGTAGAALYTGFQYNELFGLEFGYNQSQRKQKTHTFGPGDLFFGTSPLLAQIHSSVQYASAYVDVNAYIPMDDPFQGCLDFIYSFGIGFSKPRVQISVLSNGNPGQALSMLQVDGLRSIHDKWHTIFRVGGGLQYMFDEHYGIRTMLRYESTSRIRIRGNHHFYQSFDHHIQKIFNDSYSLSIGLVLKF